MGSSENAHEKNAHVSVQEDLLCISCSCCCPFRHAYRDEVTKKISILCGNEARSNKGVPPQR